MKPTVEHTQTLPASFTPQKQEKLFDETLGLYDLADKVLASVATDSARNREIQTELVKPLINEVKNSVVTLTTLYTEIARNGRSVTPELQATMEGAFRDLFTAIKVFAEDAQEKLTTKDYVADIDISTSVATQSQLAKGVQQLGKGGVQNMLLEAARHTPVNMGQQTILRVKELGDHAVGLVLNYKEHGLIGNELERSMPSFGFRTSDMARRGKKFQVDEQTLMPYSIPDVLDPRKTTVLKN